MIATSVSNAPATAVRRAFELARQGELHGAESLCADILRQHPDNAEAWFLRAVIEIRTGRAAAAAAAASRSIQIDSSRAAPHSLLGDALLTSNRPLEALGSYEAALRLDPELLAAHFGRGNALLDLRRPREAWASYDRVLQSHPNDAPALFNRGNAQFELNELDAALESFDRAIQAQPAYASALSNRGTVLMRLERTEEARASFDRALAIAPDLAEALIGRGEALRALNRPGAALESFDRALALGCAAALRGRGDALLDLGRPTEALAAHESAIRHGEQLAHCYNSRGNSLRALGRIAEAAASYEESLRLDPCHALAHYNRAIAYSRWEGHEAESLGSYARALDLEPTLPYAAGALWYAQMERADWSVMTPAATREQIEKSVLAGKPAAAPFAFLSMTDSAVAQRSCAAAFAARQPTPEHAVVAAARYGHERLRIAYVSADLREHAVSYLMAGVFERHDRERFEVFGISLRPAEASAQGRRVQSAFDHFIDVSGLTDLQVVERMRKMEIDIAVDLGGYTDGCRTRIFAERAAPVQVNYLGYPATMGASFMDYLVADRFVIPPAKRSEYCERIVYLPDCFQANDDRRAISDRSFSRTEQGLAQNSMVFCCFNNAHKINPAVFDVWMRLLARVPGSVLWLLGEDPALQRNLRREAHSLGIDAERLVFAARVPYPEHLSRLRLADLFLDTLPFNAGTIASDALWAGLPLLTCAGDAFAARMAGSLLNAAGLPELVTCSMEHYEARALELALHPDRLGVLRQRLAESRSQAPLFDTERFRRHLESAFVEMWRLHESGQAPQSFAVTRSDAAAG